MAPVGAAPTIVRFKFGEPTEPYNFALNINDGEGFTTNNNFYISGYDLVSNQIVMRTPEKISENVLYWFNTGLKSRFAPLTSKWEIINEGSELIFTSKVNKASELNIQISEKENRAKITGEFQLEQVGTQGSEGVKEVNTLTVENALVNNASSIIVIFDDGEVNVSKTIIIAKGDTTETIAAKISNALSHLEDWDVSNNKGSSDVVFTVKNASADKEVKITLK